MTPLLRINDLVVDYGERSQDHAVDRVSLALEPGAVLGVVGESGSGKSTLTRAVIGLLGASGRVASGEILLGSRDLTTLTRREWRTVRGSEVAMVFQNPMASLNPVLTIGAQLGEILREHTDLRGHRLTARKIELLQLVGLPEPARQLSSYPHQLSGGMRQRVAIAIAISCNPSLLLADEVTTALDVTVQAQIIALLDRLRRELDMTVVLVTHDLGVVAQLADTIAVMRSGKVVETGPAANLLRRPEHEYTRKLLAAMPRMAAGKGDRPDTDRVGDRRILDVDDLQVRYPLKSAGSWRSNRKVTVVRGVTFGVAPGETLGLVGESGSGKSSLGRAVLRLGDGEVSGVVRFGDTDITALTPRKIRLLRSQMQMIFQDPYSSLDPRLTAAVSIHEAVTIHHPGDGADERVRELLQLVGLREELGDRHPHELSGGEVQRVAIARALATDPILMVCDEPTSALDASIQSQITSLLKDLQGRLGVSYLFISHDLAVVRHMSHRIAVMYLGQFVELADSDELFTRPLHPYSRSLLAAAFRADRNPVDAQTLQLRGEAPEPSNPPAGCSFHTRCPFAQRICVTTPPPVTIVGAGHQVACHRWEEIEAGAEPEPDPTATMYAAATGGTAS